MRAPMRPVAGDDRSAASLSVGNADDAAVYNRPTGLKSSLRADPTRPGKIRRA
jgi:hypothetical protein